MKTIVIEATPCPSCGKPMPAGALAGLCPACLLAQGVGTDAGDARKGARFEPPSVAQVAKLFPQLEILGLLGAGGMGAVYKARQPVLDRLVALKVLPASGVEGVNFEERFNREARALARLSHPNIVAVHEFGKADSLHFFIMEFVDGANLRQLEQAGRLAPREALQIIPQICDALQYAHDEGVVHRDIKPENVLIDRKGRVKIADFGLAKILGVDADSLRLTAEGQVMGTPHYMAPEQVERPLAVDHRADIYSLGVVFYEMLTGDLPLGKFSPPSRKYSLDVRLDDVVLRALENDPARRYQKASEVKTQVETIANSSAPAASAAPAPQQNAIRWLGFPIVNERDGVRRVNRKEALKAFAILFGVLTIIFGLVSIIPGRNLFGWLGISGATSLQVRLLVAGIAVAIGMWSASRSKPVTHASPRTPEGTAILPPEKFSRKAIIGLCWVPFFFIAVFGFFSTHVSMRVDADNPPPQVTLSFFRIFLTLFLLLPGALAPFGTTLLGWMAVGDIRRTRGRVGGLPLAVFDGLFFPLLILDVFLVVVGNGLMNIFRHTEPSLGEIWRPVFVGGSILIALGVDYLIVRRVWRAVRLTGGAPRSGSDWWWSRKAGAITIGLACVFVIVATVWRREKIPTSIVASATAPTEVQIAALDRAKGTMAANLDPRGTVELLAVSDAGAAPNQWWTPDGTPIPDTLYELLQVGRVESDNWSNKNFVVRYRDLPADASGPQIQFELSGGSSSGGELLRDGKKFPGSLPVRASFPPTATEATVRVGFDLGEWKTVSTHDRNGNSQTVINIRGVPNLRPQIHEIGENNGQARVTMLLVKQNVDWKTRVIAVDVNDVEHTDSSGRATPMDKTLVLTYDFLRLPRARVKEFRVQVRPVQWTEFRKVALVPNAPMAVGRSSRPFKPTSFTEVKEIQVGGAEGLFDFDSGRPVAPTPEMREMSQNEFLQSSLARKMGVDIAAGSNELRLVEMSITDLAPSEWDRQPSSDLAERLSRSMYGPSRLPANRARNVPLPLTYAFRTREHGLGMMQITGFAENGPGVNLRYKMVEHAHFE
jgi:predicted Ser/Thr protein kinase